MVYLTVLQYTKFENRLSVSSDNNGGHFFATKFGGFDMLN